MKNLPVLSVAAAGLMLLMVGTSSFAGEASDAKPAGAGQAAAVQAAADETVAVVNGQKITSEFLDKIMQQAPGGEAQMTAPGVRRQILDKLIEVELIAQAAEKEGMDKTPEFIMGMDMSRKQMLYVSLIRKHVIEGAKATPDEVKAYYDAHKGEYKAEEEVKASHILVDTEDEAKKAKERLDKGEDFAAVAKAVSKCPSASRGGDLGFFGKGRMVPEFEKAAFALKEGEVSGPVKTQFGWHIIKVTGRKESHTKELDDVKAEIEQKVVQDKQKKAYDDLLAKLKSDAKIEVNEAAFKEAAPAAAEELPAPVEEKPATDNK